MDRLNAEFNYGYTKALIDLLNFLDRHEEWIKNCHLNNYGGFYKLVNALLEHRAEFRETGDCKLAYCPATKEIEGWEDR